MAGENAFDPESMAREFIIGGKTLRMMPLKIGAFRRLISAIDETGAEIVARKAEGGLANMVEIFMKRQNDIIRLFFPKDAETLTDKFFEEEMTLPQSKAIMSEGMKMNGLDQWMPQLAPLLGVPATGTR